MCDFAASCASSKRKQAVSSSMSTLRKPRRGNWLKSNNCSRPTAYNEWLVTNANMCKKPERVTP